jgi:Arf-GAP domain and FG repeat-containing protein 1
MLLLFRRGLNPPHRVKSISMATFTQEEIDFLKDRGNEFCRAIWLGLMSQSNLHVNKDEQMMKDFMSAKYELRRYYLDPVMANQLLNKKSQNFTKVQFDTKNIKVFSSKLIPPIPISIKKDKESDILNSVDFIADFSKVPAPLPLIIPSKFPEPISQPSFANFDDNPVFTLTKGTFITNFI